MSQSTVQIMIFQNLKNKTSCPIDPMSQNSVWIMISPENEKRNFLLFCRRLKSVRKTHGWTSRRKQISHSIKKLTGNKEEKISSFLHPACRARLREIFYKVPRQNNAFFVARLCDVGRFLVTVKIMKFFCSGEMALFLTKSWRTFHSSLANLKVCEKRRDFFGCVQKPSGSAQERVWSDKNRWVKSQITAFLSDCQTGEKNWELQRWNCTETWS